MKDGYIDTHKSVDINNDMALINTLSRKELKEDEVYTFSLVLCDNEIDRDNERFTVEALNDLEKMFLGKTGIFDHSMKGKDQKSRVYFTRVESQEDRKTRAGEVYHRLFAKAYMMRSEENSGLISEIEAGIKKEVSVGCSMGSCKCSVCGKSLHHERCSHIVGETYSGKVCHKLLGNAVDAYEWSFVAVPAQPGAGVIKSFNSRKVSGSSMDEIIDKFKSTQQEVSVTKEDAQGICKYIEELKGEAQLGKRYKHSLQENVMKMLPLAVPEMDAEVFAGVVEIMTDKELQSFKKAFESMAGKILPASLQLVENKKTDKCDFAQFKI